MQKHKYVSVLGDSISTLAGYNPEDNGVYYEKENCRRTGVYFAEDTWWGKVIAALGATLLVNDSYSGSMVSRHPSCLTESYAASNLRTGRLACKGVQPDLIFIYAGINDYGAGMRATSVDGHDLSVFFNAYRVMLQKLKASYPAAKIFCITLSHGGGAALPRCGWSLSDYNGAIRSAAKRENCFLLDIAHSTYDSVDGFHPTQKGMDDLARLILNEYKKLP